MIRSDERWLAIIDTFHYRSDRWAKLGDGPAGLCRRHRLAVGSVDRRGPGRLRVVQCPDQHGSSRLSLDVRGHRGHQSSREGCECGAGAEGHGRGRLHHAGAMPSRSILPRGRTALGYPVHVLRHVGETGHAFIALGAIRSAREQHITGEQREIFAALAPHVRAAIRTRLALEGQGAAVLTGAMDALSIPVFVCDRTGRRRLAHPGRRHVGHRGTWAGAQSGGVFRHVGRMSTRLCMTRSGPPSWRVPDRVLPFCGRWSCGDEIPAQHRWCSMCFRCRASPTSSALRRGWLVVARGPEARRRDERRFCGPRTR